jgi:hypothetical protein
LTEDLFLLLRIELGLFISVVLMLSLELGHVDLVNLVGDTVELGAGGVCSENQYA